MDKSSRILNTVKEMFPNASCELNYNNHFELLVAVVLSAQTTDKRVNFVTKELFEKYKDPLSLANANYNDVYNLISSLGLTKMKTNNIINLSKVLVNNYNSIVPSTKEELIKLPGVGDKTANAVLMEGFNIPAIAVDTHVSRVSQRLGLSTSSDVKVIENGVKRSMVITLKTYNGKGVIEGIERVSKPSRRIHCGSKDIPRVRNGQGTVIISTPKGIISGEKAAELTVGGEIICYVW